jgi:outer membrane protein OmpA-like peptidoglycan-associated protein
MPTDSLTSVFVIPFAFNKYALGQSQVTLLIKLQKSNATKIKVVGYAQPSKNQPDIALSLDRAIEVKKSVSKLLNTSQISIEGLGSKKNLLCEAYKNKCVVIYVKG